MMLDEDWINFDLEREILRKRRDWEKFTDDEKEYLRNSPYLKRDPRTYTTADFLICRLVNPKCTEFPGDDDPFPEGLKEMLDPRIEVSMEAKTDYEKRKGYKTQAISLSDDGFFEVSVYSNTLLFLNNEIEIWNKYTTHHPRLLLRDNSKIELLEERVEAIVNCSPWIDSQKMNLSLKARGEIEGSSFGYFYLCGLPIARKRD